MFATTQMPGLTLGFPDVCMTPVGPTPVPIPYPNLALPPMGVPAVYNVLFQCAPAHNLATTVVMTNGDNAGIATGVCSATVMGPARPVTGAFTVLVGGIPAQRVTSINLQNTVNCPGVTLAPSQVKVLLLAP
jgi:hypothetical protein